MDSLDVRDLEPFSIYIGYIIFKGFRSCRGDEIDTAQGQVATTALLLVIWPQKKLYTLGEYLKELNSKYVSDQSV
jgi:hypothetical protein